MKFAITYTFKPETRDEAIARFKKTGGQAPEGATLLGRWTAVDMTGGILLMDSADPSALTEFALRWSDIMDLRTAPVLDDQELSATLQRAGR